MKNRAAEAVERLDRIGSHAFITCESGPDIKPQVVAKFKHIQDAQEFHRALVQCGEAARLIESGCEFDHEQLIEAASGVLDGQGPDLSGRFYTIEAAKLDLLRKALINLTGSR